MTVLLRSEWTGTSQEYDEVSNQVQEEFHQLAGNSIFHVMFPIDESTFSVIEVWDSRENCDAWFAKIGPIIEKAGLRPANEPVFYEVYNYQSAGRLQDA